MTTAYVYKWHNVDTYKWYVGSRTAKGCHPGDGYICSSKTVKPLIKAEPAKWIRTIIATGEPKEMRELEATILQLADARNDSRSYNKNNCMPFCLEHGPKARAKLRKHRLGKKMSEQSKEKIRVWNTGRKHSEETKARMRQRVGILNSPETRAKISKNTKGKPKYKIACPHCDKIGGSNAMKRFHFDNCKERNK